MHPIYFPQAVGAKTSPALFSKALCLALILTMGSLAKGETSAALLLPHPELLKPRIEPGTLAEDPAENLGLHIVILQGDRGANIIKKKTAVTPVVEVRDRNNTPVAGASVTFTAPSNGPSMVFINGSKSITVVADAQGKAVAMALKAVNLGRFQMAVTAAAHAQSAVATLSMTNFATIAAAGGAAAGAGAGAAAGTGAAAAGAATAAGISTGVIAAIGAVAAAAAIGTVVAVTHHSGSSTPALSSIGITLGSGATVGAPH